MAKAVAETAVLDAWRRAHGMSLGRYLGATADRVGAFELNRELVTLVESEEDLADLEGTVAGLEERLERLEFQQMLSGVAARLAFSAALRARAVPLRGSSAVAGLATAASLERPLAAVGSRRTRRRTTLGALRRRGPRQVRSLRRRGALVPVPPDHDPADHAGDRVDGALVRDLDLQQL